MALQTQSVDVALWTGTSPLKVSVAKAMESLVKLLHEEHALVQGQAK